MNEEEFVANYLQPSDRKLDKTFTYPLPDNKGFENTGDFIVQCELEKTFSTNIVTKYINKTSGIRLVEVYKNTQNKDTGIFLRIIGSIIVTKNGYPTLSIDPPVLNVDPKTGKPTDLHTFMSISLPQAREEQNNMFFNSLKQKADKDTIPYNFFAEYPKVPPFWGSIFWASWKGLDLDMMQKVRNHAWSAYRNLIDQTDPKVPFDYRPLQDFMVFEMAKREHETFAFLGLSVPAEAQAAFFSVMFSAGANLTQNLE